MKPLQTPEEATRCLRMLKVAYNGRVPWNNKHNVDDANEHAEHWTTTIIQYRQSAVMTAIETAQQENPEFCPTHARFLQLCQEHSRQEMRELAQTQRLTGAITCDGNSWIHINEDRPELGMRPCKHCNPWQYEQWLNNNHDDFVGRDTQREQKKWLDNHTMPPTCKGITERSRPLPPSEGIQIAKAAYLQEIERLNREQPLHDKHGNETSRIPNTKKFDHFINAVTP